MRRALLALAVFLLFSCSKEEFSVASLSLSSETDIYIDKDGVRVTDERVVLAGTIQGSKDDSYSFRISSPDEDLVWEGEFDKEVELELTPGAVFPSGAYSIILYSTNGTEYTGTVDYHGIPDVAYYTDEGLSKNAYTEEFTKDGIRVAYGKRRKGDAPTYYAERIIIKEDDEWGSNVTLTQDFI